MNLSSLFGLSDHLEALSKHGDPLEGDRPANPLWRGDEVASYAADAALAISAKQSFGHGAADSTKEPNL